MWHASNDTFRVWRRVRRAAALRRTSLAGLALLAVVGLTGCAAPSAGNGAASDEALPRLGDIRSRVTPTEAPEVERPAPERRAAATIKQVQLPLHTDLDESWAQTNERVLAERARTVWNANGVRAGLISTQDAEAFFDPLPYVLGVRHSRLISAAHPSALRTSPPLSEPVQVDLSGAGDGQGDAAVVELDRGRVRLLIAMEPNAAGGVTVTLLPHHQVRRLTLEPRDPLEKDLDGRVFEELAVSFDLNRDDVLVLGLYWPWPDESESEATESADDEAEQDEATEPAQGEAVQVRTVIDEDLPDYPWESEAERGPELEAHLGRALFASRRGGGVLQTVVLVHVEPTGGAVAASAPEADAEQGVSPPVVPGE